MVGGLGGRVGVRARGYANQAMIQLQPVAT